MNYFKKTSVILFRNRFSLILSSTDKHLTNSVYLADMISETSH